jgi:hypothetical protein
LPKKDSCLDVRPRPERFQKLGPGDLVTKFQRRRGIHPEEVPCRPKVFHLLLARHVHVVAQKTDTSEQDSNAAGDHRKEQQTLAE